MQEVEKEVLLKQASLYNTLEANDADSVDEVSIHDLAEVKRDVEKDYLAVQKAINGFCLLIAKNWAKLKLHTTKLRIRRMLLITKTTREESISKKFS